MRLKERMRGQKVIIFFLILALIVEPLDIGLTVNSHCIKGIQARKIGTDIITNDKKITKMNVVNRNTYFILQSDTNYAGSYIRGYHSVLINGSLVTEDGTPVVNGTIEVYLNISDHEALKIGEYQTDSEGRFNIIFLLPLNTPLGNKTVTIYFPGDIRQGLDATRAYYWILVYGRVFMNIEMESRVALFERNLTISAWLNFDNGSRVRLQNLPFKLFLMKDTDILLEKDLSTDINGVARDAVPFDETGIYTVNVTFNTSIFREWGISEWLLSDNQDIVDDTIIGSSETFSTSEFEVYLATKIDVLFQNGMDTIYANRTGDDVIIRGTFLNTTGQPDEASLIIRILYEDGTEFYRISTLSDINGEFSVTIRVNSSFLVGTYTILCEDLNESTVDLVNPLSLIVFSSLAIEIDEISPSENEKIQSGSTLKVHGVVYDIADGYPIDHAEVKADLIYSESGETISLGSTITDNGYYNLTLQLPNDIPYREITILLRASHENDLYYDDEISIHYQIYNFIYLNVTLNTTSFLWIIRNTSIVSYTEPVMRDLPSPSLLIVNISIYDDFSIPWLIEHVAVYFNDSIIFEGYNDDSFVLALNVTNSGDVILVFPDFDANITISLVSSTGSIQGGGVGIKFPPLLGWLVIVISIVVLVIVIRPIREIVIPMFLKEQYLGSMGILLNLENSIAEKDEDKIVNLIKEFILQLAKEMGFSPPESFTLREILYNLHSRDKRKVLDVALNDLLQLIVAYEIVVYGKRNIDNVMLSKLRSAISNLKIFLKSLEESRGREIGETA